MGTRKAVAAVGYAFAIVDGGEVHGIGLRDTGVRVRVDGVEYPLMKAGAYAGSRAIGRLLDRDGRIERRIGEYRIR